MTAKVERRRVLVVDDYPDAREMYAEYLKYSGFDVIEAGNGREALDRALDSAPDIILMDLSLPVMDGWEATRRLKADKLTAGIPIVEHLTGLEALPPEGFRFTAAPPRVEGMETFPVRAFAVIT